MKNEFEILNDMNVDFSEYDSVSLNEQEVQNIKHRVAKKIQKNKIKSNRKLATAAVLALCLVGLLTISNGTVLAAIRNVGVQLSEYVFRQGESYDKYKTIVGQTVTDNGLSIKLNYVIVDDSQFLINCDVNVLKSSDSSTNPFSSQNILRALGAPHLYIDGKQVKTVCYDQTKVNSDGSAKYEAAIDTSNVDLNKTHNFKVVFDRVFWDVTDTSDSGKWEFKFNADGKTLSEKVISIPIKEKITLNDKLKVNVEELRITPLSMRLFFSQGKVDHKWVSFKAISDDGEEIQGTSWSLLDDGKGKQNFILKKETKKIKLVPMIDKEPQYDKAIIVDLDKE